MSSRRFAAICFEQIRDGASKTDAEQLRLRTISCSQMHTVASQADATALTQTRPTFKSTTTQTLRLDGAVQDLCGGGLYWKWLLWLLVRHRMFVVEGFTVAMVLVGGASLHQRSKQCHVTPGIQGTSYVGSSHCVPGSAVRHATLHKGPRGDSFAIGAATDKI